MPNPPPIAEQPEGCGGYDSLTGGILCAPSGKTISDVDISVFIDKARLQPPVR
jgi:hypothetical protein